MAATSGSEKDNLIAQFIGVTGADRNRATFFLDSSGWKLEVGSESCDLLQHFPWFWGGIDRIVML